MGLDVDFYITGKTSPVLSMRNHWDFFGAFPPISFPPDAVTDFWVSKRLLDELEANLFDGQPAPVPRRRFGRRKMLDLLEQTDGDTPWEELEPLYRRVLEDLRKLVEKEGALICSWSC